MKPKLLPQSSGSSAAGNPVAGAKLFPVPKSGPRKARIFYIVNIGMQNRPDYEEAGKPPKPQDPCEQLVVVAHLVNDEVDYGGDIGVQPYGLLLNKQFKGDITGFNFTTVRAKDGDGNILWDEPQIFHPASPITKLAKATGTEEIIKMVEPYGGDVSRLLDKPLIVDVEVKETPAKGDKKGPDGKPIVYRNVNVKGFSKVPMEEDDEGNERPAKVKPLKHKPFAVDFDTATEEHIKFIRKDILRMIKLANNYAGSQMQKAIEAYEAKNGSVGEATKPAASAQPATPATAPAAPPFKDEEDDDVPF
jgi:hypothetical protein